MKLSTFRISSFYHASGGKAPRTAVVALVLSLIFSSVGVTVAKAYCPMMKNRAEASSCSSCDKQDHAGSCCKVKHERLSLKSEYDVLSQKHVVPLFATASLATLIDRDPLLPDLAAAPVAASETPPLSSSSLERCLSVSALRI
jgi:hypothetical protein